MLCVIIPANNEADYIGACLQALVASDAADAPYQIIVAANGCSDATAQIARGFAARFAARGWQMTVLEIAQSGKLNAMNLAEAHVRAGASRAYLDADARVAPPLLAQIDRILARPAPAYASGRPQVLRGQSWVTRAYARIWTRLPFMQQGVPGCGFFAVNPAGRARWGALPDIISDDTFVRLNFAPEERLGVPAGFGWPMVEGLRNLIRVRRRQDAGVRQVARLYPELLANDEDRRLGPARVGALLASDPIGFAVYATVALVVRLTLQRGANSVGWVRGR